MNSPSQPLNVREINFNEVIGTPQDSPETNTVIGLLKSLINILK